MDLRKKRQYRLDIYTDNIEQEVKEFLQKLNSACIQLKAAIPYFDLPVVSAQYDIGVVLYKGQIPNYMYNVLKKVMENLACSLSIIFNKELFTTSVYQEKFALMQLKAIDFINNLDFSIDFLDKHKIEKFEGVNNSTTILKSIKAK